jgi:hypothetical protein
VPVKTTEWSVQWNEAAHRIAVEHDITLGTARVLVDG